MRLIDLVLRIFLAPIILVMDDDVEKNFVNGFFIGVMSIILLPFWIIVFGPMIIFGFARTKLKHHREQKSIARGKQYLKEENIHLLRNEE